MTLKEIVLVVLLEKNLVIFSLDFIGQVYRGCSMRSFDEECDLDEKCDDVVRLMNSMLLNWYVHDS